jgi:CBS domain-containing protein
MERHDVKRLPVVDEEGNLVGIVARRDMLRRFLRPDEQIRTDVLDSVLRGVLWLDPIEVDVAVAAGHVRLGGKVDRRSTAQIAARLVRGLDGVVGLTDELEWEFDDTTVQQRQTFNV